jgi:hypothetical protein
VLHSKMTANFQLLASLYSVAVHHWNRFASRRLSIIWMVVPILNWMTVDSQNSLLHIFNYFVVNFDETSILSYFGQESDICISGFIEHVDDGCFSYCSHLRSVTFEPSCRISIFGEFAFSYCTLLESMHSFLHWHDFSILLLSLQVSFECSIREWESRFNSWWICIFSLFRTAVNLHSFIDRDHFPVLLFLLLCSFECCFRESRPSVNAWRICLLHVLIA